MEMYNEKTHASIIGLFYRSFREEGEKGIRLFVKAAQFYAEQRGRRMSLRALRDGHKLDFDTYLAYGEWSAVCPITVEYGQEGNDFIERVYSCPWAETFAEMDLKDCGLAYCREIDKGLVRGFNPELVFELKSVLHDSACCVQVLKNYRPLKKISSPPDAKKDWQFHCAHIFSAMSGIAHSAGMIGIVQKTEKLLAEKFGQEVLRRIINTEINFNLI
jgi:hypothetical protein